jgi:phage host-nuclease inhibitor protein Gam
MKREKKIIKSGISAADFEQQLSIYAAANAEANKIKASMDVQFVAIRERYKDKLEALEQQSREAFDLIQQWAVEHRDTLFRTRRSMEHTHGILGFRTGTPKLKTLKGFTWSAVLQLLKEFLPDFVRTTEEPAKDLLIAQRDNEDVNRRFPQCGIQVVQDESFFIELKTEEP